jgi:hypothetical protein
MLMQTGSWLRQQREGHGWARREMAARIIQAARAARDTAVPGIDSMCRNIRRWEERNGQLTDRYILYYCTALGIPAGQFGTAAPPQPAPPAPRAAPPGLPVSAAVPDSAGPRLHTTGIVAYGGKEEPGMGDYTVAREVVMAAHEASDHAEQAGQPGIGDATFEQLRADVTRLSGMAASGEPLAAFLEARRVRERLYRLLDQRLWPREQTTLYFLLGCLNGLMGMGATQLGYLDSAEELHRAGWAYANAIDHRPLMARLRCELSQVAYFRGRYEESRDLARSGLEYLSDGPEGSHLYTNYARAAGRMGDAEAAQQAVRDAHDAFERSYNDDLLEIGGQFAISKATHYSKSGAALTATAGAEREAAGELENAIGLFDEGPRPGETHWFAGKPLAGVDLAVVRLRSGALEAATAALQSAFALSAAQRITDVTVRLAAVRAELAAPIYQGSAQARDLGSQIEEFGRETAVAGLHSLPGG